MLKSFTDLTVWKESQKLLKLVYKFSDSLPSSERHNRVSQIRRATSSISANIAEGYGRYHWQENIQFCRQARGSLEETRSHILAALDLNQGNRAEATDLLEQINLTTKLLNGYIRFLEAQKGDRARKLT